MIYGLFTVRYFIYLQLKYLFEHIWNDWKLQKTRYEVKIMCERAEITRLLIFYYLSKKNIKFRFIQGKKYAFLSARSTLYFCV